MQRVKPGDLQVGMIIAEPIMDMTGKVLLEAKAILTKSNIDLLQTWDVSFVRIREEADTDQSIEQALRLEKARPVQANREHQIDIDPEIAQKIGISEQDVLYILRGDGFSQSAEWKQEQAAAQEIGSLATTEGIQFYWKFVTVIDKLLMVDPREKEFSIKEFNEVARLITDYVRVTPGVLGYALRPLPGSVGELARHLVSTAVIAGKLAMLLNYSVREMNSIILAGLIHDIGKIGLPEHVANRSRQLTASEETLYQSHVQQGIARIKSRNWIPREVLLAMAQHHERMDGKGFPMGFRGDKIHPYAKIIALADYIDDAFRGRCGAAELIDALPFLAAQFDPDMCGVLRGYLTDFLLSNTLKLDDGRTAQIIYRHQSFSEPVIRTSDGEFIDLNATREVKIARYSI